MAEISLEEYQKLMDRMYSALEKWKDENKQIAVDYATSMRTVQDTLTRLDATEKRFWNVYKPYILAAGGAFFGILIILLVVFAFSLSGHFCGTFNFPSSLGGGSYIGKSC